MRHQWKFAQIEGNLQQLELLTLNDPDIDIELTDEDFGGLKIEDAWVSLTDLRQCSRCNTLMVSDHGGDYMAILGGANFFECSPLNK